MSKKSHKDSIYTIETNIDDMNPQLYSALMDKLFKKGALDVFWIPVQAKQNRPGILVTVLCEKKKLEEMIEVLFRETTTFGVRYWPVERRVLTRKFKMISSPYGKVKVKVGSYKGEIYTESPEYKNCKSVADKKKVPVKDVLWKGKG